MPTAPKQHKPKTFKGEQHNKASDRGQHSALYNDHAWRKLRLRQLAKHPLCAMCEARGRVTAATVCDHIEPHRGDLVKFWAGPFQSLCKRCHDKEKQRAEVTQRVT